MRKVEPLPNRDCEAGYGPDYNPPPLYIDRHVNEFRLFQLS